MCCYTYIIRCKDNSLYTGYTTDINRRIKEHKNGINSKYTRARGFLKLEIYFLCKTKSDAMKLEYKIKSKTRRQKLDIIENPESFLKNLKEREGLEVQGFHRGNILNYCENTENENHGLKNLYCIDK
ncbi:GIY-YIG nuclease family protein [Intestinibacter sp.]|uniref:GIY-YIG nuclease family protein n=1 Tax=Intestinibacter sp. TaxID=1965304 RepID=UPI002F41E442